MFPYVNYVAPFIDDFAQKTLMFSDAMGYINTPGFVIDRTFFNDWVIMFTLSGFLYVEQYGQCNEISAGKGILMDLRQPHKYYFSKKEMTEIVWMHFNGAPCSAMLKRIAQHYSLPLIFEEDGFLKRFQLLQSAATADVIPDAFENSSIIYNIISNICSQIQHQEKYSVDDFSANAFRYIILNLEEKFNLQNFATHMNMSKYHFCRKFKQEFSCTPFEYMQQQKIKMAKRMLIFTQLPISEVANTLAFYDQSHFNRTFSKIVGMSPSKFRGKYSESVGFQNI